MEKGFAPPSAESAPPYPGPPMTHPGPPHPSAPMLFPTGSSMHESAPPYPGPPSNYPGAAPAQAPQPGGVYSAPMTTLTGPPYATQPRVIGHAMNESAPPYPGPPMHIPPGGPQSAMYPPPPGLHPGGPAYAPVPTTAVVVQAHAPVFTTTVVASVLRDVPGQTMCPHCQRNVITHTEHTSGLMTWLICGGLCLVGCGPCSFIPFCLDSCRDVEHLCPNCRRLLFVYKRMN